MCGPRSSSLPTMPCCYGLPAASAVLILVTLDAARGLAFCPIDHQDVMWDTWLYKNPKTGEWLLNYLEHHHGGPWNAVGSALSVDGAHWADAGPGVRMDCSPTNKTDCAVWLGSGSVWKKLPTAGEDAEQDEWIMNYSQEYDCHTKGDGNGGLGSEGGCQSIFFATSKDLVNWQPVAPDAEKNGGNVFKYNTSQYARGRWDCIAVLPRPGGGYYGYWTATPLGRADLCGTGKNCGAGFGQSDDGLHWTTLPTPGPAIGAEVGGLCQLGGKTFMTFDAGHLFQAPSATGPFTAVTYNYNFFTQEGHSAFARLWGELYTGDKELALISHQQIAGPAIYAGLIKQAVLGDDGVLRAQWWSNNDVLKAGALTPVTAGGKTTTECIGACLSSGLWLEGTLQITPSRKMPQGVWVELNGTALKKPSCGFGFAMDASGNFSLGEMDSATGRMTKPLVIDRAMKLTTSVSFKLLLRNAWSGLGMSEFYVDDVLALPFTLPAALTGSFAATDGKIVKISGVNRLSLPEASR
jgi:hypothetical protein